MKTSIFILMISIFMESGFTQNSALKSDLSLLSKANEPADTSLLNFYCQYGKFTDPGAYAYLFENLPDSLPELCRLIRSQFIHPYAELSKYREQIPKERWNEMFRYPSVKSILEGLLSYDSSGIVNNRKPEDRLVLICRHNSILLASILKSRGIPARVRYGHATYLIPNFHTSHAITEVWNDNEKRWMLVDPSTDMVDFSQDKFDFSNDAWLQFQKGEIDPNLYGIPGKYAGVGSIVAKLCGDLASILGTEHTVTQYPPILDFAFEEDKQLTAENIETLNSISELMQSIDADNFRKLRDIYHNTPEIQITKTFNPSAKTAKNNGRNSASKKNQSNGKNKIIETGQTKGSIFDFYRKYSSYTDPGAYAYLYENLPDSLPELCRLIRSQFIHPYAELPRYRDQFPKDRWNEAIKYPTVNSLLEGLLSYDSRGLVKDRKPENRLVLGCRHNAILLASIMKYRGIPARVRAGHVTYLRPGFHLSHTICEVWNENDDRWMLVDPSTAMVDFSRDKFDFSNELWLKLQNGEIDPDEYGFPGRYSGLVSILGKVCPDLASILGTEYPINHYAPILEYAMNDENQLSAEHIDLLNKISELMKSLDADNLMKLHDIYDSTPQIQITKSFEQVSTNSNNSAKSKNN